MPPIPEDELTAKDLDDFAQLVQEVLPSAASSVASMESIPRHHHNPQLNERNLDAHSRLFEAKPARHWKISPTTPVSREQHQAVARMPCCQPSRTSPTSSMKLTPRRERDSIEREKRLEAKIESLEKMVWSLTQKLINDQASDHSEVAARTRRLEEKLEQLLHKSPEPRAVYSPKAPATRPVRPQETTTLNHTQQESGPFSFPQPHRDSSLPRAKNTNLTLPLQGTSSAWPKASVKNSSASLVSSGPVAFVDYDYAESVTVEQSELPLPVAGLTIGSRCPTDMPCLASGATFGTRLQDLERRCEEFVTPCEVTPCETPDETDLTNPFSLLEAYCLREKN